MQPQQEMLELSTVFDDGMPLEKKQAVAAEFVKANPRSAGAMVQILVQANHALHERAGALEKDYKTLAGILRQPPNPLAALHSVLESEPARALVSANGRLFTVGLAPGISAADLRGNQYVLLNGEGNVLVGTAPAELPPPNAAVATFSRGHGARAIVRLNNGEELVLDLAGPLAGAALREGDLLLFDKECCIAWEKVETRHQEESLLEELPRDVRITQLPGMERVFREVFNEVKLHLLRPDLAATMRLDQLQSLLLYGAPGCGKTSLVKCLATELEEVSPRPVRAVLVRPSIHRSKWYGESEERARRLMAEIRQLAASGNLVLAFFDDMDHLGSRDTMQEVDARVLPTFLGEVETLRRTPGVLLVGATNRPDLIDGALMRAGRFGDRRFKIPPPSSREAAGAILRRYLPGDLSYSPNGVSGQERREEIVEAALSAMFAPNGEMAELATLHFRDGSKRALTPAMLMSGAFLKTAAAEARRRSAVRAAAGAPLGLTAQDLMGALDDQLSAQVAQLRPGPALHHLLDLPPDADVVKLAVPERRGRPKLHHHLNEGAQ